MKSDGVKKMCNKATCHYNIVCLYNMYEPRNLRLKAALHPNIDIHNRFNDVIMRGVTSTG